MKCPLDICNGTGFKPVIDETGNQSFIPCDCRKQRDIKVILRQKLIEACIPPRLWGYNLDNYLSLPFKPDDKTFNAPNISILKSFIDNPSSFIGNNLDFDPEEPMDINSNKQILWIWGRDPNACHTTLAVILGTSLVNKGYKVRFISMQSLLDIFTNFESKEEETKKLHNQDVIIIDDAFDMSRCVTMNNYKQGTMFSFINEYLNQNKHLICTSCMCITDMDQSFTQIKTLLLRSKIELELRGDITSLVRRVRV